MIFIQADKKEENIYDHVCDEVVFHRQGSKEMY